MSADPRTPGIRPTLLSAGVPNDGCHNPAGTAAAGNTSAVISACSTPVLNPRQETPQAALVRRISCVAEQEDATAAIFRDIYHTLETVISITTTIRDTRGQHSQGPTTLLAGSTTDDNIHMYLPMQKRLKTQLNQSEHIPLSTPAVPKEKTLAQVEMKIAGAEKIDMFRNAGIPTRKTKTRRGLRPPFPPLHISMALPVLPDVAEESITDDNIHIATLPENTEKIATIAASNATAGAGSLLSEQSLVGVHNNSSHEDGDDTRC